MEEKMRKNEKFNCKKCKTEIGGHNQYLHDGMCDDCFFKEYLPEEKDPFSEKGSKGECRLCKAEFNGKEMKKHVSKCAASLKGNVEAFMIKASSGPFWVYFSVPSSKELIHVDRFLRDLWLECCGHLSAFEIGETRYNSYVDESDYGETDMKWNLKKVMSAGTKFRYVYDFGTSTELELECISAVVADSGKIMILARNNIPDFRCENCEGKADKVCVQCVWDEDGFVCKKCMKNHKCVEPSFLPIVNSPRVGMCGFTGEECKMLSS